MSDIFISYKREEREKSRIIASMLVKHGYDVWWDAALLPGDRFAREIDEVIKTSKVAIVLWSQKAVDSDFIRAEASRAYSKKIMISAKLDECEIPLPYNIHHFLDLSQWDNSEDSQLLQPLLKAVEKKIGSRSVTVQTQKEIEKKVDDPDVLGEIEFWKSITDGKTPNTREYQSYIEKYGLDGVFYDLAKVKIGEFDKGKKIIRALVIVGLFVLITIAWIIFDQPKPEPELVSSRYKDINSKSNKLHEEAMESIRNIR